MMNLLNKTLLAIFIVATFTSLRAYYTAGAIFSTMRVIDGVWMLFFIYVGLIIIYFVGNHEINYERNHIR